MSSDVLRSIARASMSAPASSSSRADSTSPARAANISAVNRPVERARMPAPDSASRRTTSVCPPAAAHISAVCPASCSASRDVGAAGDNPRRRRCAARCAPPSSASSRPTAAVRERLRPPRPSAAPFSTPPLSRAIQSGGTPRSFTASMAAPASIRRGRRRQVVPVDRPVERRGAVRLRGVHVRAALNERPGRLPVLALRRLDHAEVVARPGSHRRRRRPGEHDKQHGQVPARAGLRAPARSPPALQTPAPRNQAAAHATMSHSARKSSSTPVVMSSSAAKASAATRHDAARPTAVRVFMVESSV